MKRVKYHEHNLFMSCRHVDVKKMYAFRKILASEKFSPIIYYYEGNQKPDLMILT